MLSQNYVDSIRSNFRKAVDDFGKEIILYYHTETPCTACSVNPITGESMDSNCPSCHGTGIVYSDKTLKINGVTKSFITSLGFIDSSRGKIEWAPIGDGRITCELEQILKDPYNPDSSDTILPEVDYIQFDNKKYKVKGYDITNIGDFYVIVITLERFSGTDVRK